MRPNILWCITEHLFHGRITIVDATQAILSKGTHAQFNCFLADDDGGGTYIDQLSNLLGND